MITLKAGSRSPWGKIQSIAIFGGGSIAHVSTAGHGGIKLDRYANERVHVAWRRPGGWYEEDVEWSIVALTFGTDAGVSLQSVESARQTAKDYYPDEYQAIYGPIAVDESLTLRERAARELAVGRWQILACWGDWAENVPGGMVGVFARVGGRGGPPGSDEGYFLVTAEQYEEGCGIVRVLPEGALPVLSLPGGRILPNHECPFRLRTGS